MAGESILGRAKIPISGDLSQLDKDLSSSRDKVSSAITGIAGNITKILGGAAVAGAAAITGALTGLGKLAIDAAPVVGLQNAFEGLATSSGQSMDSLMASLQKGSGGMISQRDLMKSYNSAAQLVSTTFANQLPDAMGYLSKVSAATGQDMGFMLDSLVKGVGRLSPMILDNLAIQVNATEANAAWAKSNGLAASSVVDNTEDIAKENATLKTLHDQLTIANMRFGEFTESTSESTKAAAKMKIEELTQKLSEHGAELADLTRLNGTTAASIDDLTTSMTKGQQQEAMMAMVMEKLKINTAAMPEVTGSAAAGMAAWTARIQDTKDKLGLDLQPALAGVMTGLGQLADKILPPLIDFFETKVVPVVEKVSDFFGFFAEQLGYGFNPAVALQVALRQMGLGDLADKVESVTDKLMDFKDKIQELWDKVTAFLKPVTDWIGQNVKLQDVLIALALIIAATVIPAVVAWVISMGPILLVVAAVIAIVALFRKLSEDDFAIVKTAVAAVGKAFEDAGAWIVRTVANIRDWFSQVWADIKNGIVRAWESIVTGVKDRVTSIEVAITNAFNTAKGWIEQRMKEIPELIRTGWDLAKSWVVEKVVAIVTFVRNLWSDIKEAGANLVEGLRAGISEAWNKFKEWVGGKFDDLINWIKGKLGEHSESTVTKGIAFNMMLGMASGIDEGSILPLAALDRLNAAMINKLALIPSSLATAPTTFAGIVAQYGAEANAARAASGGASSPGEAWRAAEARNAQGLEAQRYYQAQQAAGINTTIYGGVAMYGVQDAGGLLAELQALGVSG